MLKFLCISLTVALGVVLSIPMEMTTLRPEATTEDTSGRLLSLPDPEKCAKRPKHFEHGGHHYWFSGDEENFTDHKVDWLDGRNICREYCMDLVSLETPTENELIEKFLVDSKSYYLKRQFWNPIFQTTFLIFGAQAACATLRVVTGKIFNPPLWMGGSGLVLEWRWLPPTPLLQAGAINPGPSQVTRHSLKGRMCRSQIMQSLILTALLRLVMVF